MPNQLEPRVADQMCDILLRAREEIVDADDIVALLDQPIAKMAAEKAGTSRNENGFIRHEAKAICESSNVVIRIDGV